MSDYDQDHPPSSYAEYLDRFGKAQRIFGYGIAGASVAMPCPFCAAPDFLVYRIIEVEEKLAAGATCRECGRSAKALFQRTPDSVSFEIVQTGGMAPPEWLQPPMRRVS